MIYLILSIICSVSVGAIFKMARTYEINLPQVLAANYLVALLSCYLFFSPDITVVNAGAPWLVYILLMVLLPSVFFFLAASVAHMGIVKTDAAQRLSLFIPVLAAWLYFKEDFNDWKVAGLLVGFPAIVLILYRQTNKNASKWHYPAIVLVGFGIIDILFKQLALHSGLPYTTSLFVVFSGALAVTLFAFLYTFIFGKQKVRLVNLGFGGLVGIFNFGNILFYLNAHKEFADNPSTVFAAMNMGVIITGTLVGIIVFREKLSRLNYIGIVLALAAVILITLSQLSA